MSAVEWLPARRMHRRCMDIELRLQSLYRDTRRESVWAAMESNIPPDIAECHRWIAEYECATADTPLNPPRVDTGD